jgi:tellurite resistance protein
MNETSPSRAAALFLQLVLGLQQSGMMTLGKLMNPISRKIETNLEVARDTIDTLAAIEARTHGNLDPDEERVLRQVLTELRMNYLDTVKKSASASGSDAAPAASGSDAGD